MVFYWVYKVYTSACVYLHVLVLKARIHGYQTARPPRAGFVPCFPKLSSQRRKIGPFIETSLLDEPNRIRPIDSPLRPIDYGLAG